MDKDTAAWRYPEEMNLFLSCFVFLKENSVLSLELLPSEEMPPEGRIAV